MDALHAPEPGWVQVEPIRVMPIPFRRALAAVARFGSVVALVASCSGGSDDDGGVGGGAGAPPVDASSDSSESPEASRGGSAGAAGDDSGADAWTLGDAADDDGAGPDADGESGANLPPIPLLSFEIELNKWVVVNEGDTVWRPLDADINWNACASYDPDGAVAEIWLKTAGTTQLLGPSVVCQEHTQSDHTPKDVSAYLLVRDDHGAEAKLSFKYKTQ